MVGNPLLKKRDPEKNVRAYLIKAVGTQKNRTWDFENKFPFMCKDLGFKSVSVSAQGIVKKEKTGTIETDDLTEDQVQPNDKIEYLGVEYIVTNVAFDDNGSEKYLSPLRASGTTTIEVKK